MYTQHLNENKTIIVNMADRNAEMLKILLTNGEKKLDIDGVFNKDYRASISRDRDVYIMEYQSEESYVYILSNILDISRIFEFRSNSFDEYDKGIVSENEFFKFDSINKRIEFFVPNNFIFKGDKEMPFYEIQNLNREEFLKFSEEESQSMIR